MQWFPSISDRSNARLSVTQKHFEEMKVLKVKGLAMGRLILDYAGESNVITQVLVSGEVFLATEKWQHKKDSALCFWL